MLPLRENRGKGRITITQHSHNLFYTVSVSHTDHPGGGRSKVGGFCYTRDVACAVSCRVRNSLIVHLWTPLPPRLCGSERERERGFQSGGQTITCLTVARLVPPTPEQIVVKRAATATGHHVHRDSSTLIGRC